MVLTMDKQRLDHFSQRTILLKSIPKNIISGFLFLNLVLLLVGCGGEGVGGQTTDGNNGTIPTAPTGVVATPGNGQVTISWIVVSGATSYNIYMASASGVTKSNYSTLSDGMKHTNVTKPYTHIGLNNGTTYYFVVTAVNADGESAESSEVSGTPSITPLQSATSVAAGDLHTCALLSDGTVRCWGLNNYGQLGNGTQADSSIPVGVNEITTAVAISAGDFHTCAVLSDGTVKCWGANNSGQLGNGNNTGPESCSGISCSITPITVSEITTATTIATGTNHTCALLSDGTVRCWGDNSSGQLGNGTQTNSFTPVGVTGITTTATSVAAGDLHTCALLSDGTVRCWGDNYTGQLGNGTQTKSSIPVEVSGTTTATAIAARRYHTCAILSDRTVECWGMNISGQLGNGTNTGPESCSGFSCSTTPVEVSGITMATATAAGLSHTCAVLADGTVRCWGANFSGQLGNGTNTGPESCYGLPCSTTPVGIIGITMATTIAAGGGSGASHTCAVLADGTVRCWGDNSSGQLGNGTTTNSSTPVTVIER
jgi:alpha-tubulin suppressor-like RCC1 family protein